jgi:Bcr/CflA subfamily drug resistance transporter
LKISSSGTGRITFFILLLILYNQLGIDIYLPSMPAMVRALNTTSGAVRQTLTLFFLGFSLSTFLYGAIAGSCGRRPILLFGILLFLFGSLLCTFAPTIEFLLVARFIQGLGSAGPSVLSRAIMRDAFEGADLLRRSAYRSMMWITIPIVAPLLGGYIQHYLGWRWNFGVLAIFSAIVFGLVLFLLPETQRPEYKRPLRFQFILQDYKEVLKTRLFWGNVLGMTLVYAMLVAYNVVSPFLIEDQLGFSPVHFGWILVFTSIGYFLGSFLSSRLTLRIPIQHVMTYGFIGCLFFSSMMLLLSLLDRFNLWTLILPMFGLLFASALVYPACVAGSVAPFSRLVGVAAALVSCIVFFGSTLMTSIASPLPDVNALPLAVILFILSILTPIACYIFIFRSKENQFN